MLDHCPPYFEQWTSEGFDLIVGTTSLETTALNGYILSQMVLKGCSVEAVCFSSGKTMCWYFCSNFQAILIRTNSARFFKTPNFGAWFLYLIPMDDISSKHRIVIMVVSKPNVLIGRIADLVV